MRVRVTIEYDYEDPSAFDPILEGKHWMEGGIDCPTLNDGDGCDVSVKAEQIS